MSFFVEKQCIAKIKTCFCVTSSCIYFMTKFCFLFFSYDYFFGIIKCVSFRQSWNFVIFVKFRQVVNSTSSPILLFFSLPFSFFLFLFPFFPLSCTLFLDASSHLYKRVCPPVRPSVRPLVGRWRFCQKQGKSIVLSK